MNGLVLDPSFLLTARGRAWVVRCATRRPGVLLSTSHTLSEAMLAEDRALLGQYSAFHGYPNLGNDRIALGFLHCASLQLKVEAPRAVSASQAIMLELMSLLETGATYVARRIEPSLSLAAVGFRIVVQGADHYEIEATRLREYLGTELSEALFRRTRYLGTLQRSGLQDACADLVLFDQGRQKYR